VGLKSEFKPVCKKIWKAFNSWRKRGMWFRVTVLLIIGSVPLYERLITKNHVPLINEFVLTACKAIRYASEPRVTSAYLRYLHVQKSRQLQKQLREKVKYGSLHLNANEMELLSQNTLNANYNKLFELAKQAKLIPANISLSQTKRAMLDKSLKLTAERFDPEWEDVRQRIIHEDHCNKDVLLMKLKILGYGILAIFPLPVIPALPWFILCLTLGMWGASFKSKVKFSLFAALSVVMTFVWLYFSAYLNGRWEGWRVSYLWSLLGISIFLAIWALIGSILGGRLYKYTSMYSKEKHVFIFLLLISGISLVMPVALFCKVPVRWYYFLSAGNLLFKSYAFVPYFLAVGIAVLCYVWFLVYKNYAGRFKKSIWLLSTQCLLSIFIVYKVIYLLHILTK
jgi:hypothetical protein